MKIYHNSRLTEYRNPLGAAVCGGQVSLSVSLEAEYPEEWSHLEHMYLRLWDDSREEEQLIEMTGEEGGRYTAVISIPEKGCLIWYYFIAKMRDGIYTWDFYYGNNENNTGGEGRRTDNPPSSYQITCYEYAKVPSWFKEGVVYQIFPDRFSRDEAYLERCEKVFSQERKGQERFLEEDWEKPAYYVKDEEGNVTGWPFYGGSLKGLEEKLDYISSLGVSVIYLNPIFEASSNHRYDTADYTKVDSILGSQEDFESLAKAAKEKGIRIILDGVFSHTGADSIYFDKYGNYGNQGAYGNPDSRYRKWYTFKEEGTDEYSCWWGVTDLPEVIETEESYQQMICGEDGVLAKWLRAGASGWRLDVADELPDSFIREIRRRIKAEGEDNLLMGEVWEDASNKVSYGEKRKYFMGEELDSTMHYPLRDIILDFIEYRQGAWMSSEKILSLMENYPPENFYGAMNLIGSHDRERILSVLGDVNRVKQVAVLQFTLPGVPCIYYGDEAGMTGGADPDNRNPFPWGREREDLSYHYRMLGLVYQEHPDLKDGSLRFVETGDDDVLGFIREGKEKLLILVNRTGDGKHVRFDSPYGLDLLASEELRPGEGLWVLPNGSRIILLKDEAPKLLEMKRTAGVICHVSSIPGGRLGKPARDFVDDLCEAGIGLWQILPLNPPGLGNSPYSSQASFAGNEAFINEDELPSMDGFESFCEKNSYWLDDYAMFVLLKEEFSDAPWLDWPEEYRNRRKAMDEKKLAEVKKRQFIFASQWKELRGYANDRGVEIIGDLPVFVSKDSVDVWAGREQFLMDIQGHLKCHAGVPPDYFSPEGQDWGNPLYDWKYMREDGYQWWIHRLSQCMERYDYVRLDHFRSFSEYYAVPEGKTPKEGTWQKGAGIDFFEKAKEAIPGLRIIAEDLGQLDNGVYNLLRLTGYPGMNVWQFSEDEMNAMTREHKKTRVFYTGTHDNQTLKGWSEDADAIIEKLYMDFVPWVILQMQDILDLDDSHRMNIPGTSTGNWGWNMEKTPLTEEMKAKYRMLSERSGRKLRNQDYEVLKEHDICCEDMEPDKLAQEMADFYLSEIQGGRITGVLEGQRQHEDRTVLAIDMGGTNTRVAKVRISGNQAQVLEDVRLVTPGREDRVSVSRLFETLAEKVLQIDPEGESEELGFAFSFPGEPSGRDMRIIEFDKELQVEGGEHLLIGEALNSALAEKGHRTYRISVMNDTVATYMAHHLTKAEECSIAFILGTGANMCIRRDGAIYNLESGFYEGFPRSDVDLSFDQLSGSEGKHLAEKMMSGAYLADLIAHAEKLLKVPAEAEITERAALYAAVHLAAGIHMAGGRAAAIDGSLFWKKEGFKEQVKRYLEDMEIPCEFVKVEEATLLGAAAAAVYM